MEEKGRDAKSGGCDMRINQLFPALKMEGDHESRNVGGQGSLKNLETHTQGFFPRGYRRKQHW